MKGNKRRERPRPLATNQVEQFYCQPLGQAKGKPYSIPTATKACIVLYCIELHCIALHCVALHCFALHCNKNKIHYIEQIIII